MSELKFFEGQIQMPLVKLAVRSTLLPLRNGKNLLISPIKFNSEQLSALKSFSIEAIIAPNAFHHLAVPNAKKHLPEAKLYASPGLQEKRADIAWDLFIDETTWPYADEISCVFLKGAPKFSELIFYHHDTKTLIVTDLFFNLNNLSSWREKLVFGMMGTYNNPNVSRLLKMMTKDKKALKESLNQVLQFDFDRMVVGHGNNVSNGAKDLLASALKNRGLI